MPRAGKNTWTPERRAKFAETMKRKGLLRNGKGVEVSLPETANPPAQETHLNPESAIKENPEKDQTSTLEIHFPGEWEVKHLGDQIKLYVNWKSKLFFYADPRKTSGVIAYITLKNAEKETAILHALPCKLNALKASFITRSIPNDWPQEINFHEIAIKNLQNPQNQKQHENSSQLVTA